MTRSSEDWISESVARLKRLERERVKYRSLVETTTDPEAAQRHAVKLARLNNELNHLRKGIQIAQERMKAARAQEAAQARAAMEAKAATPIQDEPDDDFDRDEYLDILDDAERPTEQFNANDVGPDGQRLGDMIAAAAAKRAARLEETRAAQQAADADKKSETAEQKPAAGSTSPQNIADPEEAGPTLALDEDDLALQSGAQGRMLVWGILVAVLVGGVLSYVLMQ